MKIGPSCYYPRLLFTPPPSFSQEDCPDPSGPDLLFTPLPPFSEERPDDPPDQNLLPTSREPPFHFLNHAQPVHWVCDPHLQEKIESFFETQVSSRLVPFISGMGEEGEVGEFQNSFMERVGDLFQKKFPGVEFPYEQLFEAYLRFAITRMNVKYGIVHSPKEQFPVSRGGLSKQAQELHMDRLTMALVNAVKKDFPLLTPSFVHFRKFVSILFNELYQNLMVDYAEFLLGGRSYTELLSKAIKYKGSAEALEVPSAEEGEEGEEERSIYRLEYRELLRRASAARGEIIRNLMEAVEERFHFTMDPERKSKIGELINQAIGFDQEEVEEDDGGDYWVWKHGEGFCQGDGKAPNGCTM